MKSAALRLADGILDPSEEDLEFPVRSRLFFNAKSSAVTIR